MTIPQISAARLGGSPTLPLLVLGPSLGTSGRSLWSACAAHVSSAFEVLAWDLPGHGTNDAESKPFTLGGLAAGVLAMIDAHLAERGEQGASFAYAGDSVGGAVGLQLMLDAPDRIDTAVLLCTAARIGEPDVWRERAASVRASGTSAVIERSVANWFAPGFLEREPDTGAALVQALRDADREGYAQVCEALATFDVRHRLHEIGTPVLAVAGAGDVPTPPSDLDEIAVGVLHGRLAVLDDVAHLAPAERPDEVARLIREHALGDRRSASSRSVAEIRRDGMTVRRDVLGDAHVDRAISNTTDLTADFQDFITQYAWGSVWTRPGLDRRSRSLITLTALVARGHHEELAMHLRAARTNGLADDEIKELLLQTAIYCGVPDANAAFRIAQDVLGDTDQEPT